MQKLYDEGKIYQAKPGAVPRRKMYLDESKGVPLQDIWTDIVPVQGGATENAFYPTQKPTSLLERILAVATDFRKRFPIEFQHFSVKTFSYHPQVHTPDTKVLINSNG